MRIVFLPDLEVSYICCTSPGSWRLFNSWEGTSKYISHVVLLVLCFLFHKCCLGSYLKNNTQSTGHHLREDSRGDYYSVCQTILDEKGIAGNR